MLPAAEEKDEFIALEATVEMGGEKRAGTSRTSPVESSQRVGLSGAQVALPQSPILLTDEGKLGQAKGRSKRKLETKLKK